MAHLVRGTASRLDTRSISCNDLVAHGWHVDGQRMARLARGRNDKRHCGALRHTRSPMTFLSMAGTLTGSTNCTVRAPPSQSPTAAWGSPLTSAWKARRAASPP